MTQEERLYWINAVRQERLTRKSREAIIDQLREGIPVGTLEDKLALQVVAMHETINELKYRLCVAEQALLDLREST